MADNKPSIDKQQQDGVRIKIPGVVIITTIMAAVVSIGSTATMNAYDNGNRDAKINQNSDDIKGMKPVIERMDKNVQFLRTRLDPTYKGPD